MPCYLRFAGLHFDVDSFIKESGVTPDSFSRRGDDIHSRRYPSCTIRSSCRYDVSESDFDDFKGQVSDVIAFLNKHVKALSCWREYNLDHAPNLDFGIYTRMFKVDAQSDFFPAELIRLAGELGASIEFSQYSE